MTTFLRTKISEVERKIPDASSLVTTTVLNTKISDVESKILDHTKFITAQEVNKLTSENSAAKLKQADLVHKTNFDNKLRSFDIKLPQIKLNI